MTIKEGTREILIKSLIELMEENQFNEITVKEIAFKAGVSRRTFYCYFSSTKEAIKAYAIALNSLTLEEIETNKEFSNDRIAKYFFEAWRNNKEFYKLLLNDPSIDSMSLFESFIEFRIAHLGTGRIPRIGINRKGYINSFVIGGLYNLIKQWLNTDDTENTAEVIHIFSGLMNEIDKIITNDHD